MNDIMYKKNTLTMLQKMLQNMHKTFYVDLQEKIRKCIQFYCLIHLCK